MNRQTITIADREVGPGQPAFLIAEVAQAHDGSLGAAHAYIDAAAEAGADAIKFQTHIADAESTLDEPFRVRFSPQDERPATPIGSGWSSRPSNGPGSSSMPRPAASFS
jgi:N,N'-diacetyllegionaminate synthase